MRRRSTLKSSKTSVSEFVDPNVKKGAGKFTFHNGDAYEGEYKFHSEQLVLVKQGNGVYTTDDFNVYDGKWNNDKFADSEIHIRYNNGAQYRGGINANGAMSGPGTYVFPDGSSMQATWIENKPFADIVYKEPLGFAWNVESISQNGPAPSKRKGQCRSTGTGVAPNVLRTDHEITRVSQKRAVPSMISFTPGNHFWNDMCEAVPDQSTTYSTDSPEQN